MSLESTIEIINVATKIRRWIETVFAATEKLTPAVFVTAKDVSLTPTDTAAMSFSPFYVFSKRLFLDGA